MLPDNTLSPKAFVGGFSFPVKQPGDFLVDWELAGVALNDPSEGLMVKLWKLTVEPNTDTGFQDVVVSAPGVAPTVLFSGNGITEAALSFDQNMNPFVAYLQSGVPKIYWYDPTIPAMTHTTLPAGCYDLRCTLDDKRQFNVGESDIVLGYIRAGNLCVRYQRERYAVENILRAGVGADARLVSMAMNTGSRLQFRVRGYVLTDDPGALIMVDPFLGDIVYDLCRQAGIAPENIDVSELYDPVKDRVPGLLVDSDDGLDKPIQWLMDMFQFDKVEHGGKLRFIKRGRPVVARIPFNKLIDDHPKTLKRTERDRAKLPRTVNINHIDPDGGFAKNKQSASRRTNMSAGTGTKNINSRVVLTADQAASAALRKLKIEHNEYEDFEFTTRLEYTYLTPGDVIEVEDFDGTWYRMHLKERNEDDGNIKWEAETDGGYLVYDNVPFPGKPLDPPVSTTPGNVGDTQLEILNLPVNRDQDDELGLYIAARGASSGWTGYTLMYSLDAGVSYTEAYTSERFANIGETVTAVDDDDTSVEVLVPYPLASVSAAQIAAGQNRAVIGDEEIQYQTATLIDMVGEQYHYLLTGVVRGVLRTAKEAWGAGIRFVVLDDEVMFLVIPREHYEADIYYKAVSIGQSADEVTPIAYLFDYAASQTEWAGTDVVVTEAAGGGITVTWDGAERLGTFGPNPYHSRYMIGYQVKFSDGHTIETTAETVTYPAGLMGTPVEVRARNAITGLGPLFGGEGEVDPGDTPVFGFSGSFPDLYEKEGVVIRPGDNGIAMSGGYWDANARGIIVPGVGAICGGNELSITVFTGVPYEAGTFTSMVRVDASSPEPGGGGTADINQSVTVLPRPTHGLLDLRLRDVFRWSTLVDTSPPWKKFNITRGTLHFYGVTSGKVVGQVRVTSAEPDSVLLGISSDRGELAYTQSPVSIYTTAPSAVYVGDGTYSIELDADTGDFWIYEDVAGTPNLIHSGNQPLDAGAQYRIGAATSVAQTYTAEFNGGNEPWFMTVTQAGHGGIPVPPVVIPLAWGTVEPDYGLSLSGNMFSGTTVAAYPATGGNLAKSNALYSSGKWRFSVSGAVTFGICVDAFTHADGFLGTAGTPNSVGFYNGELSWSWGGGGSIALSALTLDYPNPIMALDADTDKLLVYFQDHFGTPVLAHTLSLPAGQSWRVAARVSNSAMLVTDLPGPPGYVNAVMP